uniref:C4 n=1 Tax=Whitefly-associated begomovirus 7 TaxID=2169744 RepID=A0A0P0IFL5_9GEMI|nr:C4 [Whitefly-associated begomovirus 7]ALK03557.1 C4 [Whitefly-associated begomovirus 7]ALK03563.1 C4 [Whitefly-associated begomovirus 7]ALK03569.1 C4 [Whitefly-associated begomovirus 7]ALK03575.1 C4 [Whitefly-associated begomovirus 7]
MKTGLLTCMPCYSSKESSNAKIQDSSIWSPQVGQHISIATYRELNPAPMSSPISRKVESTLTGENSRSMADLQEEANKLPMTLTPQQLTLAVRRRLLE